MVSQIELFAQLRDGRSVNPSVIPRSAVHVNMIIQPHASFTPLFPPRSYPTDISPVVITEKQHHVIRHLETFVIIPLYLRKHRPKLRYSGRVFPMYTSENFTLSFNHIRQHSHVLLIRAASHGHIPITAHSDGHDTFVLTAPFRPFDEERINAFFISGVIPRPYFFPPLGIILMRTHHRLMMGSAHHDAHIVCQLSVRRVILIKRTGPHGRPHVVGFQPEQQFEHMGIKATVEPTELRGCPTAKARPFVVQENATVFHFR